MAECVFFERFWSDFLLEFDEAISTEDRLDEESDFLEPEPLPPEDPCSSDPLSPELRSPLSRTLGVTTSRCDAVEVVRGRCCELEFFSGAIGRTSKVFVVTEGGAGAGVATWDATIDAAG